MSEKAEKYFMKERKLQKKKDPEKFERTTKEYRKQRKEDRTERVKKTIEKDLDLRDRWMGIRNIQKEYKAHPYNRSLKDGAHVKLKNRAEGAAEYLREERWGGKKYKEEKEKREQ